MGAARRFCRPWGAPKGRASRPPPSLPPTAAAGPADTALRTHIDVLLTSRLWCGTRLPIVQPGEARQHGPRVACLRGTPPAPRPLGRLHVLINTVRNRCIEINPRTRIPRTFKRFQGLMSQLLGQGKGTVTTPDGEGVCLLGWAPAPAHGTRRAEGSAAEGLGTGPFHGACPFLLVSTRNVSLLIDNGEFRMGKIPHVRSKNAREIPHQIEIRNLLRGINPVRIFPPAGTTYCARDQSYVLMGRGSQTQDSDSYSAQKLRQ